MLNIRLMLWELRRWFAFIFAQGWVKLTNEAENLKFKGLIYLSIHSKSSKAIKARNYESRIVSNITLFVVRDWISKTSFEIISVKLPKLTNDAKNKLEMLSPAMAHLPLCSAYFLVMFIVGLGWTLQLQNLEGWRFELYMLW